jgi:hypothetical protein
MEDPPANLKKPRKPLSQESLDKLAKARQKANAIRAEATKKKLEGKLEKINTQVSEVLPPKEEPPPDPPPPTPDPMDKGDAPLNPIPKEEPKEEPKGVVGDEDTYEEEEVKIVKKATNTKKKGKKPVVIVEQESDESDFDDNDRVIFVKRRTQKPKKKDEDEQLLPTARTEPPQSLPPPVRRQQPTIPQKTPQELIREQQYNQMFNGGFLNRNKFY